MIWHSCFPMAACRNNWFRGFAYKGAATRHGCPIPSFAPCPSPCLIPSGGAEQNYGVWPPPLKWHTAAYLFIYIISSHFPKDSRLLLLVMRDALKQHLICWYQSTPQYPLEEQGLLGGDLSGARKERWNSYGRFPTYDSGNFNQGPGRICDQ